MRLESATRLCLCLGLISLLVPQAALGGEWTLTSDNDFLPGQVSNLVVSGGSLQLPKESGSMSSWITETNLSSPVAGHAAAVVNRWGYGDNSTASNGWLFIVGGRGDGGATSNVVRYSWSGCTFSSATTLTDAALPAPTYEHTLVPLDAGLLVIGGLVSGQPSDQVVFARYTYDAKLHPWGAVPAQLPEPRWRHASVAHGGYVYVIGGSRYSDPDSASRSVYYANPTAYGRVLSWSTTTSLPEGRADLAAIAVDEYLYVIGGSDSTGAATSTVYRSQIASDGTLGAWQAMPSLAAPREGLAAALQRNEIMVVGGRQSGIPRREVFRARIDDETGNLSSWETGTSYDFYIADHVVLTCSSGFLALGGEDIFESIKWDTRRTSLTETADYARLGSYLSPVFDLGDEHLINALDWTYTANGQTVRVRARTAGADGAWLPWSAYSETGSIVISATDRFAQFEVSLRGNSTATPLCELVALDVPSVSFVSGTISSSTTWSLAAEPFVVTGTITVTGGTFTVEPGVEVRFRSGTGLKVQQANVYVNGLLGSEVLWTSLSDSLGEWGSIYYDYNSDDGVASDWSYAVIEKAGEDIWNVGSTLFYLTSTTEPTFSDCTFRKSIGNGIRAFSSRPSMILCTIEETGTHALYASGGGDTAPNLAYCTITGGSGYPTVFCSGANPILLGTPVICPDTVAVYLSSASPEIRNSQVTSGSDYAIRLNGSSFPDLSGNNYSSPYSPPLAIEASAIDVGTWSYDGVDYAVLGSVEIRGGSQGVTIEPGVTLYFVSGAQLLVGYSGGGSIHAVGTVGSPITFTSLSGAVGDWGGISLYWYNESSRFERCIIEKAGPSEGLQCYYGGPLALHQTTFQSPGGGCLVVNQTPVTIDSCTFSGSPNRTVYVGGSDVDMQDCDVSSETGVALENSGSSTFDNVTFASTDSFAVYSTGGSPLFTSCSLTGGRAGAYLVNSSPQIQGSQVTSVTDYAIRLNGSSFPDLSGNSYSSPYSPLVAIEGSSIDAGTWRYNDIAGEYAVLGSVEIRGGSQGVMIEPGVTLYFVSGAQLLVGYSGGGSIHAVGTVGSPITFTSLSGAVGDWGGISLYWYNESSRFERCIIEKAGQSGYNANCYYTSSVVFTMSQIKHSSANGIQLNSSDAAISRCDISENGAAGIYVTGGTIPVMGGDPANCNRLCDNGTYDLNLQTSTSLDASHNWWCSTDPSTIAACIYDGNDQGGLGIVTFQPVSEEACLDNNPVEHFSLLSPGDTELVSTLTPTFTWEQASDPDSSDLVRYRLLISEDDQFTAPTVYEHLTDSTYTVPAALPDNTSFWWKVVAYDWGLLETPSNETWTFTANVPPTIPEPILPVNGEDIGLENWLVWFASEDPGGMQVTYHVQADDDTAFASPEINHTGLSVSQPPGKDDYDGPDKSGPVVRAISIGEISGLAGLVLPEGAADQMSSDSDQGEAFAVQLGTLPGAGNLNPGTVYCWRVQALDNRGAESGFSDGTAHFVFDETAAVPVEEDRIPGQVFLSRGTPNPFSHTTLIEFGMPEPGPVTLQVFNVQGKMVRRLIQENRNAGSHSISWDGRNDRGHVVPSGTYFCRIETCGKVKIAKTVLIR